MPISSLPSPHGIGTMGKAAYEFVDFLAAANQAWWQILPVGPTSYGDSPYQSFSAYAGNPYLVDLDMLCKDGLLTEEEITAIDWGTDPALVDYSKIYENRIPLLQKAKERGWKRDAEKVSAFVEKNRGWLPDYALFMALKRHFGMVAWTEWPDEEIRLREPASIARYTKELAADIELFTYIQYLFFTQWQALRAYAHEKGKASIICVNKWDLIEKNTKTMELYRNDVHRDLAYMTYAPVAFFSALTGSRLNKIFELIKYVNIQHAMRISTGVLNDVLNEAITKVQPPSDKGKRLKV